METLPKFGISRADMLKRVARFKDLHGAATGLPDSDIPGHTKTIFNVFGSMIEMVLSSSVDT